MEDEELLKAIKEYAVKMRYMHEHANILNIYPIPELEQTLVVFEVQLKFGLETDYCIISWDNI